MSPAARLMSGIILIIVPTIQVRSGLDVRHTERRWPPSSGAPYCAGANDCAASACTIGVLTRNQMA